ncbi:hypothetical protein HYR69_03020 [Candidatus Sumerlaeota bacterium]|nr:hypothetical protein [Candidatus Sumerlaeota bacterium]
MGEILKQVQISIPANRGGDPGGLPSQGNPFSRALRWIGGAVALAATAAAGIVFGGVLLILAGFLFAGGLAFSAYMNWKMKKMLKESGMSSEAAQAHRMIFMKQFGGGKAQIHIQRGGFFNAANSAEEPPEEPIDVEIISSEDEKK